MSDRVWKDYTVETVVGKTHKSVEGVVDPTKESDAGYMDEGRIKPLTSEMATKTYRRRG